MLDTRKSGLIQSSPPSMSRTEMFIQNQGGEVKDPVRSRGFSYLDKDGLTSTDTSRLHSETGEFGTPAAPTISGHPRLSGAGFIGDGVNGLVNGSFAADTDWIKGTGWTIAAGLATCSGVQAANSDLTQTPVPALVAGQSYVVTFIVANHVTGNVTPVVGDIEGTDRAADGTYTETIVAGVGTDFDLRADITFDGSIDIVSIERASGSVGLGEPFSLFCGAASSIGVTYQWQLDASDVVGAVNPTLEVAAAAQADAGVYTCDVTNTTGVTSSAGVTVTVV